MNPNIRFEYLYRDYSNYKNYGAIILSNPRGLVIEELDQIVRAYLIDRSWFYAHEWNVPDLHFDSWDAQDDHFLHEFVGLETANEAEDARQSIDNFVAYIKQANNKYII